MLSLVSSPMRRLRLPASVVRALTFGAFVIVAFVSAAAVAAQALPEDVVEHIPGGDTGVTALLVGAIVFLGKQLLSRPTPDAHKEALADLRAARTRIEELKDALHAAETRNQIADALREQARATASSP